jgi:hypothetical protein
MWRKGQGIHQSMAADPMEVSTPGWHRRRHPPRLRGPRERVLGKLIAKGRAKIVGIRSNLSSGYFWLVFGLSVAELIPDSRIHQP